MSPFREGYVYHIKDEFFEYIKDDKLMKNKEQGSYRPTFYCIKDPHTSLLWVVPMSSKVDEKYQALYDKQVNTYGNCLTIVIGEFDQKKAAFLLQNMFPITERYLDHVHSRDGKPVRVHKDLQQTIRSNMKKIFQLMKRGKKLVFPDIQRIERLMLEELRQRTSTE